MTARTVTVDAAAEEIDGRRARRERNRDAVVHALLALYREGNLAPGTDEIAERAGLSPRSLFRYFDDADDLVRAAVARQQEHLAPLAAVEVDPSLPLAERVAEFVRARVHLLEAMGAVGQIARLRAPFQPVVADELSRIRRHLRAQVRRAFAPELAALVPADAVLAAADVLCSYESFQLLRHDQGLSRARTAAALTHSLSRLLEDR